MRLLVIVLCATFCSISGAFNLYSQEAYQKTWGSYYFSISTLSPSVTTDSASNIIVAGAQSNVLPHSYYSSFATIGAYENTVTGSNSGYIAKFSSEGSLQWATYFPGLIFDVITMPDDSILVCGYTDSPTGISTPGTFNDSNASAAKKGFLCRFSPDGNIIWGTYYPSVLWKMVLDSSGDIFLSGANDIDMPADSASATVGSWMTQPDFYYDEASGNANDINGCLAKFDQNGNRAAATFTGLVEGGRSGLAIDDDDNIYISQNLQNSNAHAGYYTTPGSEQPLAAGMRDIVISKFSPDLSNRIWSRYFGGPAQDASSGQLIIKDSKLYLAGSSQSQTNIASSGSYQEQLSGSLDGFIAEFNLDGFKQWGTYYGGEGIDYITSLESFVNGLLISGVTSSQSNISSSYAHQPALGGMNDGFITNFTVEGQREWATYIGGEDMEGICRTISLGDNEIAVAGMTASLTGISTTGAVQPSYDEGDYIGSDTYHNLFVAKYENQALNFPENNIADLQLFPNPNNGSFRLKGNIADASGNLSFLVYDNLNRLIKQQEIQSSGGEIDELFELSGQLSPGIYIARFCTGNQKIKSFKLVVR